MIKYKGFKFVISEVSGGFETIVRRPGKAFVVRSTKNYFQSISEVKGIIDRME